MDEIVDNELSVIPMSGSGENNPTPNGVQEGVKKTSISKTDNLQLNRYGWSLVIRGVNPV